MHNGGGDRLKSSIFGNFQTSVTLTLDWVIRHTIVYHSSTSIYKPNFAEIVNIFWWTDGQTNVRMDGWMDTNTSFIRSTLHCRRHGKYNMKLALLREWNGCGQVTPTHPCTLVPRRRAGNLCLLLQQMLASTTPSTPVHQVLQTSFHDKTEKIISNQRRQTVDAGIIMSHYAVLC